jgi:hypothetical protein
MAGASGGFGAPSLSTPSDELPSSVAGVRWTQMVQEVSQYRDEMRSLLTHVDSVNQEEEEDTSRVTERTSRFSESTCRFTECSCPSNQTISVHMPVKMCIHGVVYLEILDRL